MTKNMFEQPARPDLQHNAEIRARLDELTASLDANGLCGTHLTHILPAIFEATHEQVRVALCVTPSVWKQLITLAPGQSLKDKKTVPVALSVRFYAANPHYWPVAKIPDVSGDLEKIAEVMTTEWSSGSNKGMLSVSVGRSKSRAYSWKRIPNTTMSPVTLLLSYLSYITKIRDYASFEQYLHLVVNKEASARGIEHVITKDDWEPNNENS